MSVAEQNLRCAGKVGPEDGPNPAFWDNLLNPSPLDPRKKIRTWKMRKFLQVLLTSSKDMVLIHHSSSIDDHLFD